MILPTKHLSTNDSLLGIGASLILLLSRQQQTLTRLWDEARSINQQITYPQFLLSLDLLYTLGAVEMDNGVLRKRARS